MPATHVPGAAGLINLVILVAALSAMNSQLYITTRMMFSLSRAGHAPRRFGELNARGVPLRALLLSCIGIAMAAVLNALLPESSFTLMISDLDVRRAVHLADDLRDPSVLPAQAPGTDSIPDVGLSLHQRGRGEP